MSEPTIPTRVIDQLIANKIDRHPLPWSIDHDWTVEVLDARGHCVMKLMTQDEAEALITYASALATRLAKGKAEVDKRLEETDDA